MVFTVGALLSIFVSLLSTFAYADTVVTVVRHHGDPNSVCLLFYNGKPAAIEYGGQWVTMWLSRGTRGTDTTDITGGRQNRNDPEYGRFTLQLTCYHGNVGELQVHSGTRQVMERPICVTEPRTYEYGPYASKARYDFGSHGFPCSMEKQK